MSSPFIGLNVKLTLHSRPNEPLLAKVLSIDASTNTLNLQTPEGGRLSVSRSDIASLSTQAAEAKPQVTPVREQTPNSIPAPTPSPKPAVSFVDPAILSYTTTASAPSPKLSPRPAQKKPKKPKQTKPEQERVDDEFDFGANLANFDKKKIWDEIRSADQTDPSTLLVSHNRIAGSPGPLVRGLNGVGPANSVGTPSRGRRDGQTKLRPNEMVLSPSPPPSEERFGPDATEAPKPQTQEAPKPREEPPANGKPSYAELEEKIRKLEAELALARRRNVLLEELAGLGLGSAASAVQQPATPSPSVGAPLNNPAIVSAVSSLSLGSNAAATAKSSRASTPATDRSSPAPAKPEPQFGHLVQAPIVTLMFPTAAAQHAALARMEAFYEAQGSAREYLTLEQAHDQRICRNYQGFNLPITGAGVHGWLSAMYAAASARIESKAGWWQSECSAAENEVLDLLAECGAISADQGLPNWTGTEGKLQYLISSTAAQCQSTLPHERLHALYFLSPEYRTTVEAQYATLTPVNRKAIEHDLSMRSYAPSVWQDEFQAYLAEAHGTEREFGNKCAEQCKQIADVLRQQARLAWSSIGGEAKEEDWEAVKWHVLDRLGTDSKKKKKASKKSKR